MKVSEARGQKAPTLILLGSLLGVGVTTAALGSPPVILTDGNDAAHPVTYSAGPFFVPNIAPPVIGTITCDATHPCDETALTLNLSAAAAAGQRVKVTISWPLSTTDADFDLYVLQGGNTVAQSASTFDPEIVTLPAQNGTYTLRVVEFDPQGQSFTVKVFLEPIPGGAAPTMPRSPSRRRRSIRTPSTTAPRTREPSSSPPSSAPGATTAA